MKDKPLTDLTADRDKFDAVLKRFAVMSPKPLETAMLNRKRKKSESASAKPSRD